MSKAERATKKFRESAVKNAKLAGAAIGALRWDCSPLSFAKHKKQNKSRRNLPQF